MTSGIAHPRALVVAAALPLLFVHAEFQPSISVSVGSASVTAFLSDFAVLVVVAAAAVGIRHGGRRLQRGRWLWAVALAFFVWVGVELLWGRHRSPSYPLTTHAVTAAKFCEYALLAPALVVLLRTARDLLLAAWSLVLTSVAASIVGVAQFFGADVAGKGTAGHRQASFLSSSDFAALSAGVLLLGVAGIALPRLRVPRSLAIVALATGVVGTIVAGAVASVLGIATGLLLLAALAIRHRELALRPAAVVAAAALVTVAGVVAIRGSDLEHFGRFLGATTSAPQHDTKIQTYAHRTVLSWIGLQIWTDHPVLGVGWEGSAEPATFEPYLPAARRRFPSEPAIAFPAASPPDRRYGVQDAWLQSLADLGVIGCALWASVFVAAGWLAFRGRTRTAPWALACVGLLVWLWTAQGFVAGIPLDALTWVAFGAAALPAVDE